MHRKMGGKAKGKRRVEGGRHRREGNIKMNLRDTGREIVHWIRLVQDSQVVTILNREMNSGVL
jgi:hypothetical protein